MPGKNALKIYVEKGFYHVYNRGVNKLPIFFDEQDYRALLSYIDLYLLPKQELIERIKMNNLLSEEEKNKRIAKLLFLDNFYERIEILNYVFMPNHFHFVLRQTDKNDMKLFIKSLFTKYSQYFNRKYMRVGHLFQGRYKAILIKKEEYLLHLSRYIHLNPKELLKENKNLFDYPWSSYKLYVKGNGPKWLSKDYILSYFKKDQDLGFSSYQSFVEGYKEKSERETDVYEKLIID